MLPRLTIYALPAVLLLAASFSACSSKPPVPTRCETAWDEPALQGWLRAHRESLILVVSDGMPYSQQSVGIVGTEAARRGLALQVVSDRAGPGQARRCDPLLKSSTLISKGAFRHFPTLFLVRSHQLLPQVIPGIQDRAELNLTLDEHFR